MKWPKKDLTTQIETPDLPSHHLHELPVALLPALSPQMLSEKLQHSPPRICGCFRVVNLRTRVIEESVIGVIADDFNRQVVFGRDFFQRVYFLRINPGIARAGNE